MRRTIIYGTSQHSGLKVPLGNIINQPPEEGSIILNLEDRSLYYANGTRWIPIERRILDRREYPRPISPPDTEIKNSPRVTPRPIVQEPHVSEILHPKKSEDLSGINQSHLVENPLPNFIPPSIEPLSGPTLIQKFIDPTTNFIPKIETLASVQGTIPKAESPRPEDIESTSRSPDQIVSRSPEGEEFGLDNNLVSKTYTNIPLPHNRTTVRITMWGGGGAGGYVKNKETEFSQAGGGGSGAAIIGYVYKFPASTTFIDSLVIGHGGNGAISLETPERNGGNTVFKCGSFILTSYGGDAGDSAVDEVGNGGDGGGALGTGASAVHPLVGSAGGTGGKGINGSGTMGSIDPFFISGAGGGAGGMGNGGDSYTYRGGSGNGGGGGAGGFAGDGGNGGNQTPGSSAVIHSGAGGGGASAIGLKANFAGGDGGGGYAILEFI